MLLRPALDAIPPQRSQGVDADRLMPRGKMLVLGNRCQPAGPFTQRAVARPIGEEVVREDVGVVVGTEDLLGLQPVYSPGVRAEPRRRAPPPGRPSVSSLPVQCANPRETRRGRCLGRPESQLIPPEICDRHLIVNRCKRLVGRLRQRLEEDLQDLGRRNTPRSSPW